MGTKITFHVYDSGICFPLSLFKLAFRLSIQRRDTAGRQATDQLAHHDYLPLLLPGSEKQRKPESEQFSIGMGA